MDMQRCNVSLSQTWMRKHAEEYAFFVGDARQFASYLTRMAKNHTWGDELTLRAACDCFKCVVHVVTTEHSNCTSPGTQTSDFQVFTTMFADAWAQKLPLTWGSIDYL
jgi:hypothetical protein